MGFQVEAVKKMVVTKVMCPSDMAEPVQVVFQSPPQQNSLLPRLYQAGIHHGVDDLAANKALFVLFEAILAVLDIC